MDEGKTLSLEEAFKEIEALKERIEELQTQNDEYLNGWKRAKADYVNFKTEQEKRAKDVSALARVAAFAQFIPVIQNFRKAFEHMPADLKGGEWTTGIEYIYRQFKDILKSMGLDELEVTVGTPLDPTRHEAIGQEYVEDSEEDAIVRVIETGFTANGVVIVPAKVVINKKPSES